MEDQDPWLSQPGASPVGEAAAAAADHVHVSEEGNLLSSFLQQQGESMTQQNQLMKLLVECHMRPSLPQRQIQPFSGNPLDWHAFVRAFEHTIESKTNNDKDKLYYIEQYTKGEANAIVKSCMYGDDSAQALSKAKYLLQKKFGDKHRIMDSMVSKAVNWPDIKPEDKDELHRYAVFITELHNLANGARN